MFRTRAILLVLISSLQLSVGCGESNPKPAAANAPAISPEAIRAALAAAEEYLASQNLAKAETIALELIEKAPVDWRGHEVHARILMMRSIVAEKSGDSAAAAAWLEKADEAYSNAVRLSPPEAGLLHSAALVARKAGRTDTAILMLAEAGRLDPRNPQYPLHEAQLLISQQRFDDAELRIKRVLELQPLESFAIATLAGIALERGENERAVELIRAAREIDPQNLALRVNESRIFRRIGRPREALELLVPLAETDRAKEGIASEIAAGYAAMGEHAQAIAAWEHCFRASAKSWRAALGIARANLAAGDLMSARAWQQTAQSLAPNEPDVIALREEIEQPR